MTMHPMYEDSLHRRLHDMSEAYDIVVERERWYNSCPAWFKPLRDMGIDYEEWITGSELLGDAINLEHATMKSPEYKAYDRLCKMIDALIDWVNAEPK